MKSSPVYYKDDRNAAIGANAYYFRDDYIYYGRESSNGDVLIQGRRLSKIALAYLRFSLPASNPSFNDLRSAASAVDARFEFSAYDCFRGSTKLGQELMAQVHDEVGSKLPVDKSKILRTDRGT